MQYFRSLFIFISFLLFTNSAVNGQKNAVMFDHLTTKKGLTHNRVFDIEKDSTGYIWVATLNGLNRYDGINIKKFKHHTLDSTSISENFIECIFIDSRNNLWIGTNNNGLNKFNPEQENFTRFNHNPNITNSLCDQSIHTIKEIKNGNLIIGTNNGISIFNYTKKQFLNFKHNPSDKNSLTNNEVRAILIDNNKAWIGTAGGLCEINTDTYEFKSYHSNTNNDNGLSSNYILSITKTSDSLIWIGTAYGLNSLNPYTNKITRYLHEPKNTNSINNNYIHSLTIDNSGDLWVGTTKGVTIIHNPNSNHKEFIHYKYEPSNPNSLSGNKVWTFYLDNNNMMWIGTVNHGINKCFLGQYAFNNERHYPHDKNSLSQNIIRSIYEDKSGNLWVGTDGGGLNVKLAGQENYIRTIDLNTDHPLFGDERILDIFESSEGDIWIGTWGGGASRFKATDVNLLKNGIIPKIQNFKINPQDSLSISGNIVQEITEDSFGNLWLGTENGLNIFNPINQSFTRFKHSEDNPHSLCDNRIQSGCIIEDKNLNLWIGTWNGLAKTSLKNFPYKKGALIGNNNGLIKFDNYLNTSTEINSLGDNRITSLQNDANGNIWIGTFGGGLNLLDLSNTNPFITKYTLIDGLPDEVIYGIEKGNNRNLWLSTNNGLSHFNPTTEQFTNFSENDDIQGTVFYWGAHTKTSKGEIIFGGTNGFTSFYPDSITHHKNHTPTIITDMSIFNVPIDFKMPNSPTKKPIEYTNEVKLTHKQNVISFNYTTINFHYPEQVNFAYILEGFEKKWNFVESRRTAIYTNLEPGKYVFKVAQVSDENKIEMDSIDSISVIIKSPFYKTQVFQIGLFIIVFLLIFILYQLKVKNIEKHKKILQQKVEERTSELSFANKLLIERNEEIHTQKENLLKQRDKIRAQNKELKGHRLGLEKQVEARTTELLIAKEKAEESDRLKSAFLANMSHEIRTPLNAVIGFSNLLNDNSIENNDRKRFIKQINKNSDDLLMLIDDIIDLSFIESAQLKINIEQFELQSFIKAIVENYKTLSINPQVKFIINNHISTEPIFIQSDPYRLRQILTNLINNALKFTEKGSVEFGYKHESDKGVFYVKDTGIGISEENQKLIFDRFRKIENNVSKLYRGNGLGLTISKRLAELLNMNLYVESELRKGSTFYLTIPAELFINPNN